jgi:hypothetical protein
MNFSTAMQSLQTSHIWRRLKDREVKISREEYDIFCKEFIFNKLAGEKFGQAFCKRFGIEDSAISILKSESFTKELIESLGYIK